MPAVALTDHGSLAGAVELYKAAREQGVKPIVGCEVYVADDRRAQKKGYAHLTLLAESNEGYANLIKLSSLGYLEGYYYKPRVDWELLESRHRADRALGLPLRARLQGARGEPPRRRGGRARPARADLRPRLDLRRAPERAPRGAAAARPAARRARRDVGAADASRPATSTTSGTTTRAHTRRCSASSPATRSRTRTTGGSTPTTSTSRRPRRWPSTSRATRTRCARTLEIAERCNVEIELGRILLPKFPTPTAATRSTTSSSSARRGSSAATARSPPSSSERLRFELKTISEMGFADYFLIVWDFIHFAKQNGISVGPGPRLGRGLARRLLPRDHRHRPDPLRPAVRALPQPGPQGHARHGHRLRRGRPRARDQLRHREVRPRPRRPDHHLLDDGRPRRRPRRRARARDPVRLGRQDREADPGRARARRSRSA